MKYTEHGLRVTLEELRMILERAENGARYDSMEHCLYITGGERPRIIQYCGYGECSPRYYTNQAQ